MNSSLYIRRGRLYMEDGALRLAQRDFKKALKVGRKSPNPEKSLDAYYYLGEVAIQQEKFSTATRYATRFIDQLPEESGAHMRGQHLLGRALFAARKFKQSARAFQAAINAAMFPKPDYYLDLAKSYEAMQQPDDAVAALEQGKQKRGELSVFDDAIVEIYLNNNDVSRALQQINTMLANKQRIPFLLIKKSDILIQMNDQTQAKQALQEALQYLETLPATRRSTPTFEQLKQNIEQRLQGLE